MPNDLPDVYSSAHFALQLDGTIIGTLRSIEGGTVKTDVVSYQAGDKGDIWRQLAKPKYEDIKFVTALAGAAPLWDWLNSFVKGEGVRKTGSLIAADYNYKEKARRNFFEALVASIDFPKWDGNDKNPANITVTISPERIVYEKPGSGKIPVDEREPSVNNQQHVAACNFKFSYDGVSADTCSRVSKVDAFSVKSKIIEYHYGGRLEAAKMPGKIEVPNLVFYLPEVDAQEFRDLHMKSVKGERAPMKDATLTFHNNAWVDRGKLTFKNCHIFNVTPEKQDATSEEIKLVKVEAAVEAFEVHVETGPAARSAS